MGSVLARTGETIQMLAVRPGATKEINVIILETPKTLISCLLDDFYRREKLLRTPDGAEWQVTLPVFFNGRLARLLGITASMLGGIDLILPRGAIDNLDSGSKVFDQVTGLVRPRSKAILRKVV